MTLGAVDPDECGGECNVMDAVVKYNPNPNPVRTYGPNFGEKK